AAEGRDRRDVRIAAPLRTGAILKREGDMTVQFRTHENGNVCCSSTNSAGEPIAPEYPCDKCKAHFAALGAPLRFLERTPMTKVDLMNKAEARLRRDLPSTMALERITHISAERGTGTVVVFQNGKDVTRTFTFDLDGETLVLTSVSGVTLTTAEDYAPPDAYAPGLQQLRAATATDA